MRDLDCVLTLTGWLLRVACFELRGRLTVFLWYGARVHTALFSGVRAIFGALQFRQYLDYLPMDTPFVLCARHAKKTDI